jgi:ankyrin repeat protein
MHKRKQAESMFAAVADNDVAEVCRVLDAGVPVDGHVWRPSASGGEYQSNALCMAVDRGAAQIVQALLARGAAVNAAEESGETALHLAAGSVNLEILEALVSAGANIEAVNGSGSTPLMKAAHWNRIPALARLIELGASPGVRSKALSNATSLHWAAANRRIDVMQILARAGADLDARDDESETPLHWAASAERTQSVQALVELGADLQVEDVGGRVPLCMAVIRQSLGMCEALVAGGADAGYLSSKPGSMPLSPFQLAVENGWLDGVRCLAENSDVDPLGALPANYIEDSQSRRTDADMQELLRSLAAARSVRLGLAVGAESTSVDKARQARSLSPL